MEQVARRVYVPGLSFWTPDFSLAATPVRQYSVKMVRSALAEFSNTTFCPEDLILPESLTGSIRSFATPHRDEWAYAPAHAYCRHLATAHYENFHVGTWLFPADVREHAYNLYAYCRWSDDLADETGDRDLSLRLLTWWREELDAMYTGVTRHPVFVALEHTVRVFDLPRAPFADLLDAFVQDQRIDRYETFADVLDYCRRSADPVGRLILMLLGYRDENRFRLSDRTCTALQLANHWQDVENDARRGRIYLPMESLRRFGVSESDLFERRATPEFRAMMKFEVDRTREIFHEGLPLIQMVQGRARFDIDLFSRGGLAVLKGIEDIHYDVLNRRPVISKGRKIRLFMGALLRGVFSGNGHRS